MADGPQRARLDQALDTARPEGVTSAGSEWSRCSALLTEVAKALKLAAEKDVRGSTGVSMRTAFNDSADAVEKKVEKLEQGKIALDAAHGAITLARSDRIALDADNPAMSEPTAFRPDPEKTADENKTAQGLHQGAVNDYWDRHARREAEAKRIADALDTKYADAAAVMEAIHGEPRRRKRNVEKEEKTGPPTTPARPRTVRPPGSIDPPAQWDPPAHWEPKDPTGHPDPKDPTGPTDPTNPPGPRDPHDPFDPHLPAIPMPPGGLDPVTTGGVVLGGGLAAGLSNAIRGGLAMPGQPVRGAGPVRPIGSTSRAAVSGALGRSGAMGAGSPVSGRGAAGKGAGVRGAAGRVGAPGQAGTRGTGRGAGAGARAAGTRGAGAARGAGGAGAGGRRGRATDDDEKTSQRDLFDDGNDWVDDEGATSPVLD